MTTNVSSTAAELEELRLENTILRQRWEIAHLKELNHDATRNAQSWRQMYDTAVHYLAVLHPDLAEIAEDDAFRIWKASVS